MPSIRKVFTTKVKVTVALEAIKEQKTMAEISSTYGVHPTQIGKWKHQVMAGLEQLFAKDHDRQKHEQSDLIQELYRDLGQKEHEINWLKKKIGIFDP